MLTRKEEIFMRIFRFIPAPFAALFLGGGLLRESIQRKQAERYAAQVVREYKPGESPYSSRRVGTLQEELERLDALIEQKSK